MKLHTKILYGLLLGLVAGIAANIFLTARGYKPQVDWAIENITDPVGQVFLRLLFMIVIPLVIASLSLGVSNLGGSGNLGRIGTHTLGFFVLVTVIATIIGIVLIQGFEPGKNFDAQTQATLLQTYGEKTTDVMGRSQEVRVSVLAFVDMLLPRNMLKSVVEMQMLPTIVLSILLGFALTTMSPELSGSLRRGLQGLEAFSVRVVDWAMRLAPVAVPCLVFGVTARFGWDILRPLGLYVALVFLGYFIHQFGVYSVILTLCKVNPWQFFSMIRPVMVTAFSTSSSNATLPTTIRVSEQMVGVSPKIAGFVLPLGATTNMNGTALYEGMTVLFIAQIFGVELSIMQQVLVVAMTVLTAIGTAGVPGGSLPLIVLVMQSVGVPAEGIGIILGVDRILDMGRTVLNVTGDVTAAVYVSRVVGEPLRPETQGA